MHLTSQQNFRPQFSRECLVTNLIGWWVAHSNLKTSMIWLNRPHIAKLNEYSISIKKINPSRSDIDNSMIKVQCYWIKRYIYTSNMILRLHFKTYRKIRCLILCGDVDPVRRQALQLNNSRIKNLNVGWIMFRRHNRSLEHPQW